jgi:UDP-glucuronate 4-epimerase
MATYLVTGAAGFIGARVCEHLLAAGHVVVGIDNLNDYYDVRLKDYRLAGLLGTNARPLGSTRDVSAYSRTGSRVASPCGRFLFRRVDIESLSDLEILFADHRFDAVFNLAARAGVRASTLNPYVFLSTNTEGTLNLLECQRRFGVRKQVLASTSSLYAGCPRPFTEDQPVNTPLSPYAAAKKAAELMAYSYHKLYDIDVSIVRYFTVFGPCGRPDMAMFRFIRALLAGRRLVIFGDGLQARDFTFVDDIASGTILAVRDVGYEIFNLGGGHDPVSLLELIAQLQAVLGVKAAIEHRAASVADVDCTQADIAKARRMLEWHPRVSLSDGLRKTAAWHKANKPLVESLAD